MIYFIADGSAIKIGRSEKVGDRFRSIETGNPNPLDLIACIEGGAGHEKAIHSELKDFRIRGEWFVDCAAVRKAIAKYTADGAPLTKLSRDVRAEKFPDARELAHAILSQLDDPGRLERAEAELAIAKQETKESLARLRALAAANPSNAEIQSIAQKYIGGVQ